MSTPQNAPTGDIAALQEMMKAQFDKMQELFAESLKKQEARINALQEELHQHYRTRQSPDNALTPNSDEHSEQTHGAASKPGWQNSNMTLANRSDRLPDPPAFTGKRKDLPAFLSKLQYKLEGNSDRFPTPRSQLLYAYSRLEGDAATVVRPMMDTDIGTVRQLTGFLEATYGDPNRRATAQARLANLRQGKKSFLSHFAEFRRLAADCDLNDSALVMQLRCSLSTELQKAMVGARIPDNMNEYANLITTYDNDLRFLSGRSQYTPRQPDPPRKDPDAMDIDSSSGYAPKDSEERKKRTREGRCFRCGSKGHISPQCSVPIPGKELHASSPTSGSSSSRGRRSNRSSPRPSRSRRHSSSTRSSSSARPTKENERSRR